MARAALSWSVTTLAENSSASVSTIKRIATENGLSKATTANLKLIRTTLEDAGIEFIGDATEGPGVRIWNKPQT